MPAASIGEVDRAVGFDSEVVGSVQRLSLKRVCQDGALAVLFKAPEKAIAVRADDQPALSVDGEAVASE